MFWAVYKMVKPFLNERTKNKILIGKNLEDLKVDYEQSGLLVEHGGTLVDPYNA